MDRDSREYLERLSRLVLLEIKRREEIAIGMLQDGIIERQDEIKRRQAKIETINSIVADKDRLETQT